MGKSFIFLFVLVFLTAPYTTLTKLSLEVHNVTVYAWDAVGNVGASETIIFTVAFPTPESTPKPESFPTLPIIAASVIAIVIVGAGLLIHFKKRKH